MEHSIFGSMGVAHLPYGAMPFYHTSPLGSGSTSPPTIHPIMGMPDPRMLAHSSSEPEYSDRDRDRDLNIPISKRRKVVYLCESCGTSYTEKRALARHKHTNQHRRNLGLPPAQRYPCTTCDKSFSRDHDRVRHENETHKGFKRSAQRGTTVTSDSNSESPPADRKDSSNASDTFSPNDGDSHDTPATTATSHSRNSSNAFVSASGVDICDWQGGAVEPPQMRGLPAYTYSRPATSNATFDMPSYRVDGINNGISQDRSWFIDDDSDSDESPIQNARRLGLRNDDDDDESDADPRNRDDDNDDDDDDEEEEEELRGLVYPPMRSTSTADSAIDMEWSQEREPKFPTIVTYDHRGESNDRDTIADEQSDQLAPLSTTSTAQTRSRMNHKSIIARHGTAQMIAAKSPLSCVFCKTPFEDDPETLLPHLRKHLESLKGEHRCKTCDIGFTHRADLDRHNASVDFFGYCGFSFHHSKPCTGHHPPPSRRSSETVGDHDSVQLFAQLRNWEHAQLRTYIAEVQDLLSIRSSRVSACYSVDALYRRSRDSFASLAVSINTLDSAPCDGGGDPKRGMGGLQQRLRMMSLKNTSSTSPPSPSKDRRLDLRTGKSSASLLI